MNFIVKENYGQKIKIVRKDMLMNKAKNKIKLATKSQFQRFNRKKSKKRKEEVPLLLFQKLSNITHLLWSA